MTEQTQYTRRASDNKKLDIEAMIAEENDPKQRSFLIVLNSINSSLMANTRATADLSNKFDEHLTRFEEKVETDSAILNQSKGAWRVFAWVLGAAQAVIVAAAVHLGTQFQDIEAALAKLAASDAAQSARIDRLEAPR